MADQAPSTSTSTAPPSGSGPGPGAGGPPPQDPFLQMLFMLVPMFLFLYFLVIRPQRKEQQKKEELLKELKPKDKVVTIFGLYATVVEIDAASDEVVLLVDPKKDVKMRFRRSAIDSIMAQTEEKK